MPDLGGADHTGAPPRERLARLHAAGLKMAAIARRLGVSLTTAERWCREAGLAGRRGLPDCRACGRPRDHALRRRLCRACHNILRRRAACPWLHREGGL